MIIFESSQPLQGIPHALVVAKLLLKEQVIAFQLEAEQQQHSLVTYLVKHQLVSAKKIAMATAQAFGAPLVDLQQVMSAAMPHDIINNSWPTKYDILPLYLQNNQLYIAMADPYQPDVLSDIQFHTGLQTCPIVVESDKLATVLAMMLHANTNKALVACAADQQEFATLQPKSIEEGPIVKYINQIIYDAITQGASDIHCEPYESHYRIRYRIDGLLYEVASPPLALANRIGGRIKIMAGLDIAERRLPQDGRFSIQFNKMRSLDCRVSTCPTVNGEKSVLRLLDQTALNLNITALGFTPLQQQQFLEMLQQPQGTLLVTGPTGSGKTVTLYSALQHLNQTTRNIVAAEDPIEIKLPGINQVNINPKAGLTFATALRAFLRQDPDIIMIGEIRDLETAEIAMKAAQTGHLVLSTLHTNSAIATVERLVHMGLSAFHLASSLGLIIGQRLARKLCLHCRKATTLPRHLLLQHRPAEDKCYQAVGCYQCHQGYKGRTAIFEVLHMTSQIREMLLQHRNSVDITLHAQDEGMITLHEAAIAKVLQGATSVAEINRIIN